MELAVPGWYKASGEISLLTLSPQANDVVRWSHGGAHGIGRVRGLVELGGRPFASVDVLTAAVGGTFTCEPRSELLVDCAVLGGPFTHLDFGSVGLKICRSVLA